MDDVSLDFVMNGEGRGSVASRLLQNNFDPGVLRPFIGNNGHSLIRVHRNGKPVTMISNTNATLRKDEWIELDRAVIEAAKPRLRAWNDLRAMGNSYVIPNGMARTVLQHETQSDITDAITSMDGLRRSESDRPVFNLNSLPLPIIHKDFHFSARQIAASRQLGSPLDMTMAKLAGRRVAEEAEKYTVGTNSTYYYGGGYIYGYTNFPSRNTKTLTTPTGSNADTTLTEVLDMKKKSQDDYHYGPWMLYCSTGWDPFMDGDYKVSGGNNPNTTLRQRLKMIDGIVDVRTLDYLTGYDLVLVQMTEDVARAVVGMDIVTVQWAEEGGMMINFKVMGILVPQVRADFNGNCGIVHGSV